jgi:restriction system protein
MTGWTPPWEREWLDLKPTRFEELVVEHLSDLGKPLRSFKVEHRRKLHGADGEYEIDAVATFEALGVNFTVLVECKHHKNPIKREFIQVLGDKVRSTGAHKGVLFSTASFQSGALDYAKAHGVALVHFTQGGPVYEVRDRHGAGERTWEVAQPSCAAYVVKATVGGFAYEGGLSEALFESA